MAAISPISNQAGYYTRQGMAQANIGQTDWLVVPDWAVDCLIFLNISATGGGTPSVTPSILAVDPVALDDQFVINMAEHAAIAPNNGTPARYVFQIGPGITGIANDTVVAANADSYVSLNAVLPPVLGVKLLFDRTQGNETYTYNLAVKFRSR